MRGSPPRLITSKSGFNASPSLAETNKTFDSNWFNGCGIKWRLDLSGPAGVRPERFLAFPFPLTYIPYVVLHDVRIRPNANGQYDSQINWPVAPSSPGLLLAAGSFNTPFTVSTTGITYPGSSSENLNPYHLQFLVFEA